MDTYYTKKIKPVLEIIFLFISILVIQWGFLTWTKKTEIDTLNQSLSNVTTAYEELAKKTEGLFESQLWIIDTIKSSNQKTNIQGGLIKFDWYMTIQSSKYGYQYIEFDFYNYIDSVFFRRGIEVSVYLREKLNTEKWEFEIQKNKYYMQCKNVENDSSAFVCEIYKLFPLYK